MILVGTITLILFFGQRERTTGTMMTVSAMSIPGIIEGLAQHIQNRGPEGLTSLLFPSQALRAAGTIPKPNLLVLGGVAFVLFALPLLFARLKIHAVEVVRG